MAQGSGRADGGVMRALHPRVLFVFDFDETLAPSTTDVLLDHLGLDAEQFKAEHVQPLRDRGWEKRLAEVHALLSYSNDPDGTPITRETFAEVGRKIELYPGADTMVERVRAAIHELDDTIDVEFHLLTAGFVHVPEATAIGEQFTSVIGGHWAFDDDDRIMAVSDTVGHYDKVRHMLALAKGLDSVALDRANDVHAAVPEEQWHCPFEQMIFVGDGDSDLPGFELMFDRGGVGIAVRQADADETWESRGDMRGGREVVSLVESDYSEGSPLMQALIACGQRAALWIAALRTGRRD